MSKIDELTKAAASLRDDQLESVIDFARSLAGDPAFYDLAPPEALESINRGLAQYRAAETSPADDVFARLRRQVDEPPSGK